MTCTSNTVRTHLQRCRTLGEGLLKLCAHQSPYTGRTHRLFPSQQAASVRLRFEPTATPPSRVTSRGCYHYANPPPRTQKDAHTLTHAHTHARTHPRKHTHTHTQAHTNARTHSQARTHTRKHSQTHEHILTHEQTHLHKHTYTNTVKQKHTRTNTHTKAHTYT